MPNSDNEASLGETVFGSLLSGAAFLLPGPVKRGIYYSLFAITPEFPTTFWGTFNHQGAQSRWLRTFLAVLLLGMGFCLFTTWMSGTLIWDDDPGTLQFGEDIWNIGLYLTIVPLYMAFCVHLIGLAARYWAMPRRHASPSDENRKRNRARFFWCIIWIFCIAILFVSNYLYDAIFADTIEVRYWFLSQRDGQQYVNQSGFFYIIFNFVLISFTLAAVFCYVSLVLDAMSAAKLIGTPGLRTAEEVVYAFHSFFGAMLTAKWLAVIYIFNILIWQLSPLAAGTGENFWLSVGAILLMGWLGTLLPRIYIEKKLRHYRRELEAMRTRYVDERARYDLEISRIAQRNWLQKISPWDKPTFPAPPSPPPEFGKIELLPRRAAIAGQVADTLGGLTFLFSVFGHDILTSPLRALFYIEGVSPVS